MEHFSVSSKLADDIDYSQSRGIQGSDGRVGKEGVRQGDIQREASIYLRQ